MGMKLKNQNLNADGSYSLKWDRESAEPKEEPKPKKKRSKKGA